MDNRPIPKNERAGGGDVLRRGSGCRVRRGMEANPVLVGRAKLLKQLRDVPQYAAALDEESKTGLKVGHVAADRIAPGTYIRAVLFMMVGSRLAIMGCGACEHSR